MAVSPFLGPISIASTSIFNLASVLKTSETKSLSSSYCFFIPLVSLVCSLVGLLIFKTALGIAGIITGILALKKIKELEDKSSKGMAIAGIVISCIDLGIGVIGFGFSIISIIINLL